jgi:rhodanese-related sulfurtransferase
MSFSFFGLFGQTNDFKSVDVEEFAKIIKDRKVTVLDVRLPQEYDEGYIPGTDFNIDVLEDNFKDVALSKLPKRKPVALYCRSGNRSKTAARILSENGYEVIELGKGFRAWEAAGKEIAYPKK